MTFSRRQFLQTTLAASVSGLLSPVSLASIRNFTLSWQQFVDQMTYLADEYEAGRVVQQQVALRGVHWLQLLDTQDTGYRDAIEQSYESGNDLWLWQRMLKSSNLNGGILNIDSANLVQLHDHPGATGMMRILSGAAEVWQFDVDTFEQDVEPDEAVLRRVSHRVLRAGDTAMLNPDRGNIHALRAVTAECRMLDFFIPPYERKRRTWYQPLDDNWVSSPKIRCRAISQQAFGQA